MYRILRMEARIDPRIEDRVEAGIEPSFDPRIDRLDRRVAARSIEPRAVSCTDLPELDRETVLEGVFNFVVELVRWVAARVELDSAFL